MAVTFLQQPQALTPSDNPIMFVFESDNTNLSNFEFLVEVYQWNGNVGNSTKLSTHRVFPTLGDQAYFDASETISNYLNACKIPEDTEVVFKAENDNDFAIIVNERFGDFTNTSIFATSNTFRSWKACLSDEDFESYDSSKYIIGAGGDDYLRIYTGSSPFANRNFALFYWNGTGTLNINLSSLDISFSVIDSVAVNVNQGKGVYAVQIDPIIWNAEEGLDITNAFEIEAAIEINSTIRDIYALNFSIPNPKLTLPLPIPQVFSTCYPLQRQNTLHFLGKYGNYSTFVFAQNFKKRKSTKRFTMEKPYGRQIQDAYIFQNTQRKTNYLNVSSFTETMNTNWLDEATHNNLIDELIESPLVFRFDEDNNIEYIQLTNVSSEYKYQDYETLFQLTINIEVSKYSKSARL